MTRTAHNRVKNSKPISICLAVFINKFRFKIFFSAINCVYAYVYFIMSNKFESLQLCFIPRIVDKLLVFRRDSTLTFLAQRSRGHSQKKINNNSISLFSVKAYFVARSSVQPPIKCATLYDILIYHGMSFTIYIRGSCIFV